MAAAERADLERRKISDSAVMFSEGFLKPGEFNKPFHIDWYNLFDSGWSGILEAPRGHAKSTVGLRYILKRIVKDPNTRVIIISSTYELAKGLAFDLKLNIEQRFPWLVEGAAKWGEKGMYVARSTISKDPTIRVASMEGVEPGPRADVIWCDDIVSQENSSSDTQRRGVHATLKTVVFPMLEPTGQMIYTGTPYNYADEYHTLETEDGVPIIRYTAIQKDGSALWPERYPIRCELHQIDLGLVPKNPNCCLTYIRRRLGTPIFDCQYNCNPSGLVGRFLKLGWLEPYYEVYPPDCQIVQGVDLAISEKETADYTAIATIGYSPSQKTIYLINLWRGQVDFPAQLKAIKDQAERYHPSAIVIEVNVYQKVLATALQNTTMLPIIGQLTVKDKIQRIMGNLSPLFESKRLVVRRDFYEFISEYLEFPDSAHDDMLDALEFACTYISNREWNQMAQYHGSGATFGKPKGLTELPRKDKDRFLGGSDWWLGKDKPGKKDEKK